MEEVPRLERAPESPGQLVTDVNSCCSPPPWIRILQVQSDWYIFLKAPLAALPPSADRAELPPCARPFCDREHRVSQRDIKRSSRFPRPDSHTGPSRSGRTEGARRGGSRGSRRVPGTGRSHPWPRRPTSRALRETGPALALPPPGFGKYALSASLNGCSGHA